MHQSRDDVDEVVEKTEAISFKESVTDGGLSDGIRTLRSLSSAEVPLGPRLKKSSRKKKKRKVKKNGRVKKKGRSAQESKVFTEVTMASFFYFLSVRKRVY